MYQTREWQSQSKGGVASHGSRLDSAAAAGNGFSTAAAKLPGCCLRCPAQVARDACTGLQGIWVDCICMQADFLQL